LRLLIRLLSLACLRYLLVTVVAALALPAVSQSLWPSASTTAQSAPATDTSVSRAGSLMLAVDQVVLPVKDYLRTSDARERDGFEQQLWRLREIVEVLEASDGRTSVDSRVCFKTK
jgi:hypothetical protein